MSLNNRYDFALIFDVRDGNPNGDPDAGNMPRLDAETGHGLVTDVALKRKVRNFVELVKGSASRYEIFVKEKSILNVSIERAYQTSVEVQEAFNAWKAWQKNKKSAPKPTMHYEDIARRWMCDNFFDVRTFGAVMSTGGKDTDPEQSEGGTSKLKKTAGQVRGPVQLTFARSVAPIVALEHSLTVCAARTKEEDSGKTIEQQTGIQGRKHTVPYGVYVAHGFVSSFLAKQTGFGEDDLELLWQALSQMFEHDRSAARGEMATRGLYVFKHDSELGNAPAHALFERIKAEKNVDVPRSFADYSISVNEADLPSGITLLRKLG